MNCRASSNSIPTSPHTAAAGVLSQRPGSESGCSLSPRSMPGGVQSHPGSGGGGGGGLTGQLFSMDDMGTLRYYNPHSLYQHGGGGGNYPGSSASSTHSADVSCHTIGHSGGGGGGIPRSMSFGGDMFPNQLQHHPNQQRYTPVPNPNRYSTPVAFDLAFDPDPKLEAVTFSPRGRVSGQVRGASFSSHDSGFSRSQCEGSFSSHDSQCYSPVQGTPGTFSPNNGSTSAGSQPGNIIKSPVSLGLESEFDQFPDQLPVEHLSSQFCSANQQSMMSHDFSSSNTPTQSSPFFTQTINPRMLQSWNHMDLAINQAETRHRGYATGALNALNLDKNLDDFDFDSILHEIGPLKEHHPMTPTSHSVNEELNKTSTSIHSYHGEIVDSQTSNPITFQPESSLPINSNYSNLFGTDNEPTPGLGRSCSLENLFDDMQKSVSGSQNNIMDFLNLDGTLNELASGGSSSSFNVESCFPVESPQKLRSEKTPESQQASEDLVQVMDTCDPYYTPTQNQPFAGQMTSQNVQEVMNSQNVQGVMPTQRLIGGSIVQNSGETVYAESLGYEDASGANVMFPAQCQNSTNPVQNQIIPYQEYVTIPETRSCSNIQSMNRQHFPDNINYFNDWVSTNSPRMLLSPKHERLKNQNFTRMSRSPSLEDIFADFHSNQELSTLQMRRGSQNSSNIPNSCYVTPSYGSSKMTSSQILANRRSRRPRAYTNPRTRSSSNPSSACVASDDEEYPYIESMVNPERSDSYKKPKKDQQPIQINIYLGPVNMNPGGEAVTSGAAGLSDEYIADVAGTIAGTLSQTPGVSPDQQSEVSSKVSAILGSARDASEQRALKSHSRSFSNDMSATIETINFDHNYQNTCSNPHLPNTVYSNNNNSGIPRRSKDDSDRLPFVCPYEGCGMAFELNSKLKRHEQDKHPIFMFRCPQCDRQFPRCRNLKMHMSSVHKILNFHICSNPECQAVVGSELELKEHKRMHSENDTFFLCPVESCPFRLRFNDKLAMKSHLQLSHTAEIDGFGVDDLDKLLLNLTLHQYVNGALIPIRHN